jgi:hypothetical protein
MEEKPEEVEDVESSSSDSFIDDSEDDGPSTSGQDEGLRLEASQHLDPLSQNFVFHMNSSCLIIFCVKSTFHLPTLSNVSYFLLVPIILIVSCWPPIFRIVLISSIHPSKFHLNKGNGLACD